MQSCTTVQGLQRNIDWVQNSFFGATHDRIKLNDIDDRMIMINVV